MATTLGTLRVAATRYGNRKLRNARRVRRVAIHVYRLAAEANRFLPPPRMLLNGHAKSGTHLLADCIALMPRTAFSGRHFTMDQFHRPGEESWRESYSSSEPRPAIDSDRLRRFLQRCPQGMFVTAHAQYRPEMQAVLEQLGYRHVLLIRDPRDVAVSHTKFVLSEKWHFHHRFYANLPDDETRLMATIEGFVPGQDGHGPPQAPLGESFRGFLRWLQVAGVHVARFEDLIGQRGGGSQGQQISEIMRLGEFLQRPLSESQAADIGERMYSKASLTYRKGIIGDWENHFTREHREAFKRLAGDILIDLGYERDEDW